MHVRERKVLLLNCLSDQGLQLSGVEIGRCLVYQLAVANHDHLRVIALDLDNILEQLLHVGEVGAVVLLHLEQAGVVVQRDDAELVGFGEAWALPIELVRGWHDHRLTLMENHMCRVRFLALAGPIKLKVDIAGWGP